MSRALSEALSRAKAAPLTLVAPPEPASAPTGTALARELDIYDHGGDEAQINALIDSAEEVVDGPSAGFAGTTGELALHDFAVTLFSPRFKCDIDAAIKHCLAFNDLNIVPPLKRTQVADVVEGAKIYEHLGRQPANEAPRPTPSYDFNLERGRLSNDCFTTKPGKRDFVLGELLPAGKVALLAGFGGVSKTQFAMQAAINLALASDCALPFAAKQPGGSLLVLGEEDKEESERRFGAIAASFNLTPEQKALLTARVISYPLVGEDMRLIRQFGHELRPSGLSEFIVAAAKRLASETEVQTRLIVVDHFMLAGDGDPSSPECAIPIMREAERIAHESGAAVLMLMHSPKSALSSKKTGDDAPDPGAFFGSIAITNKARSGLVLQAMSKAEAKDFGITGDARNRYAALWVVKNNYGKSNYCAAWLQRETADGYQVAVLRHCTLMPQDKRKKSAAEIETESDASNKVIAEVEAKPGAYSLNDLERSFGGVKRIGMGVHAFRALLKDMLQKGRIMLREPTDAERKTYGHGPQVKQVVDAPPQPDFVIPEFGGRNE